MSEEIVSEGNVSVDVVDGAVASGETAVERPTAEPVAGGGKAASRNRRLLVRALTGVLVLAAVGGGIAYTAVTVDGADRTAPTVAWANPTPEVESTDPAEGIARGRASTPLSKLLLPVPVGYQLGSDIEGYGNDGELGAGQAVGLLRSTGKGLYGKKRREYEKRIDALGVQGMAMRSYATFSSDLQVEVLVLRMKDKRAVRSLYDLRKELSEAVGFRKGPKVVDHARNAACYLVPESTTGDKERKEAQLRGMTCTAYTGEFLVTAMAYGASPFDKEAVAELVRNQLGHIDSPGEYV